MSLELDEVDVILDKIEATAGKPTPGQIEAALRWLDASPFTTEEVTDAYRKLGLPTFTPL